MKYLVSACLCGIKCRYDGGDNLIEEILALKESGQAYAVCPELLGGLVCPRTPAELVQCGEEYRAYDQNGKNVDCQYRLGAEKTLAAARAFGAEKAILKAKSPSCGVGVIYDGTFSETLRKGNGITAQLLLDSGIQVVDEVAYLSELNEKGNGYA